MKTRVISGAVLAVVGFAVIFAGGPILAGVLLFCALVGMSELNKATGVYKEGDQMPAIAMTGFVGAAVYYAALYFTGSIWALPIAALVTVAVLMSYVLTFSKVSSANAISVVFGFFYVAVMLGFIFLIREGNHGITVVWLVFLSSWIADTCAYFTGMLLGKHKMSPVLSPKKTIEGAIGGIVGSALSGFAFAIIVEKGNFLWEFPLICAIGAVISIFGDLAASAIKRDNKIKDYGNLIPGHGGILDRFDSVIFTAPGIYFLSLILIGKGF